MSLRKIQLLSPARNAETAKSAILAGADAVYMGASMFGARENASNSIQDIAEVCDFAHIYGAEVSVTLNTILQNNEINKAQELIWQLYEVGADSIIVQDMGILELDLPPIRLHASTQCHINSLGKAKFLEALGFETIVLARELGLKEISEISKQTNCKIECFVHGALCVSYSGQCYLSYAVGGRSGNRGACAQPCRMKYSLKDANGVSIAPDAYYLSLKDMNRSASLGEMLDAGVSVFKIEGRLKDSSYVKNITAYYRQRLDYEIQIRPNLIRSSIGNSKFEFTPNPSKTFNRNFCEYHLHGTEKNVSAFSAPKSRGEYLGIVTENAKNGFMFANAQNIFKNSDGLFFETPKGNTFGAGVSLVKGDYVKVGRPDEKIFIPANSKVWRNSSVEFEAQLKSDSIRKIKVQAELSLEGDFFTFSIKDPREIMVKKYIPLKNFENVQDKDNFIVKLQKNFSKLGGTPFELESFTINSNCSKLPYLKISEINAIRRELVEYLKLEILKSTELIRKSFIRKLPNFKSASEFAKYTPADKYANCYNIASKNLYAKCGINIVEPAPESSPNLDKSLQLMKTRHCILRELGMCKKEGNFPKTIKEPIFLESSAIRLRVALGCSSPNTDNCFCIFYHS